MPGSELLEVEGVRQTQHGQGVLHLVEPFQRRRSNPPGWGVGGCQVGVSSLQLLKFPREGVVLAVGYYGVVQSVIAVGVEVDFLP